MKTRKLQTSSRRSHSATRRIDSQKFPVAKLALLAVLFFVLAYTARRAIPILSHLGTDAENETATEYNLPAEGVPCDPLFRKQWALWDESIGWLAAWEIMKSNFPGGLVPGERSPVVAIVDSSFEWHDDLGGRERLYNGRIYEVRKAGGNEWTVVALNSNAKTDDHHGNASMGIMAAATDNGIGIAGAGFGVIKVLPIGTGTNGNGVSRALDFIIEQKAKNGANIVVVNMSWISPGDYYADQLRRLGDLGVVVVAASGQKGQDLRLRPQYPVCSPVENVVGVSELTREKTLSQGTSFGRGVNIAAPGDSVFSFGIRNGYIPSGGASTAAPFLSGTLAAGMALYDSKREEGAVYDPLTAPQLLNLLYSTANTYPALRAKIAGGRALNVGKFIREVEKARDRAIRRKGSNGVPDAYPDRGLGAEAAATGATR